MLDKQTGLLQGVKYLPSPNYDSRPSDVEVDTLVIHGISLPPNQFGSEDIEALFTNQLALDKDPFYEKLTNLKVSSHCLIKREGSVTQFVPFHQRAWHAGQSSFKGRSNCNDFSVGIELEGADHIPYTNEQYTMLNQLISVICAHYPKVTQHRIVGHSDIAPGRKTDPGFKFDWNRVRRAL